MGIADKPGQVHLSARGAVSVSVERALGVPIRTAQTLGGYEEQTEILYTWAFYNRFLERNWGAAGCLLMDFSLWGPFSSTWKTQAHHKVSFVLVLPSPFTRHSQRWIIYLIAELVFLKFLPSVYPGYRSLGIFFSLPMAELPRMLQGLLLWYSIILILGMNTVLWVWASEIHVGCFC